MFEDIAGDTRTTSPCGRLFVMTISLAFTNNPSDPPVTFDGNTPGFLMKSRAIYPPDRRAFTSQAWHGAPMVSGAQRNVQLVSLEVVSRRIPPVPLRAHSGGFRQRDDPGNWTDSERAAMKAWKEDADAAPFVLAPANKPLPGGSLAVRVTSSAEYSLDDNVTWTPYTYQRVWSFGMARDLQGSAPEGWGAGLGDVLVVAHGGQWRAGLVVAVS